MQLLMARTVHCHCLCSYICSCYVHSDCIRSYFTSCRYMRGCNKCRWRMWPIIVCCVMCKWDPVKRFDSISNRLKQNPGCPSLFFAQSTNQAATLLYTNIFLGVPSKVIIDLNRNSFSLKIYGSGKGFYDNVVLRNDRASSRKLHNYSRTLICEDMTRCRPTKIIGPAEKMAESQEAVTFRSSAHCRAAQATRAVL